MAKSLRSKTKRAFRKIKREDPKSDYHIRDKLRLQRLNEKLKVLKSVSDDENDDEETVEAKDGDEAAMEQDGQQGDSTHRVHDSGSEASEKRDEHEQLQTTKLYWILGMLDPESITLACASSQDGQSEQRRAHVLDVLQQLCSTC